MDGLAGRYQADPSEPYPRPDCKKKLNIFLRNRVLTILVWRGFIPCQDRAINKQFVH